MLTFAPKTKRPSSSTAVPQRPKHTLCPIGNIKHNQQPHIRHILRSPVVQPKLTIGDPNDKYEQEADRVADQVMRQPLEDEVQTKPLDGQLQKQPIEEEEEEEDETLQTKANPGHTPAIGPTTNAKIESLKGGGQPLSPDQRTFFESRMGRDFSGVRIHTDSKATDTSQAVNARAFTLGNNIVFNAGQYAPNSQEGKHLLAHELTHVVQQASAVSVPRIMRRSYPGCRKRNTKIDDANIVLDKARAEAAKRLELAKMAVRKPNNRTYRSLDRHFHCLDYSTSHDIRAVASMLEQIIGQLPNVAVTCTRDRSVCVNPGGQVYLNGDLRICAFFFDSKVADYQRAGAFVKAAAIMAGAKKCWGNKSCYDDFTQPVADMMVNPYSYRQFVLEASGVSIPQLAILPCIGSKDAIDFVDVPPDAVKDPSKIKRHSGTRPVPQGSTVHPVYKDRGGKYFIYYSGLPGSRVYLPGERPRYYFPKGVPR